MTASTDLKFSLNAILAICGAFVVLALVGAFWLTLASLTASKFQASPSPPNWQSTISSIQELPKLKTVCESLAQSVESSMSVIEFQSSLLNKALSTAAWLALTLGALGAVVLAFVYRQLRRVSKANAL